MKTLEYKVTLHKVPDDLPAISFAVTLIRTLVSALKGTGIEVSVSGENKDPQFDLWLNEGRAE